MKTVNTKSVVDILKNMSLAGCSILDAIKTFESIAESQGDNKKE